VPDDSDLLSPLITLTDPVDDDDDDPVVTPTNPLSTEPGIAAVDNFILITPTAEIDPPALVPDPASSDIDPPCTPIPADRDTEPLLSSRLPLDPTESTMPPELPDDESPVDIVADPD